MRCRWELVSITSIFLSLIWITPKCWASSEFTCERDKEVHRWKGDNFEVLVCSYGIPPIQFKEGWWRGHGLTFYRIFRGKKDSRKTVIRSHSEYYPNMDYSYHKNTVIFIIYSPNIKENRFATVPFIKETVFLDTENLKTHIELLLQKPEPNPEEVNKLVALLSLSKRSFKEKYPDRSQLSYIIDSSLYKLRNYGLIDPDEIDTKLSELRLKSPWWFDGAFAQTFRDVRNELQIIKKIQP